MQNRIVTVLRVFLLAAVFANGQKSEASLADYDAAINADEAAGLAAPLARLLQTQVFNDTNKVAFNFGTNSGAVTMEFVVEGDPALGGPDGFLAVGANATSSLRFEQWNDTGRVGFTQSGVADYLFLPAVPSPTEPVHLAWVWKPATASMDLYLNGSIGGTVSGVSASFGMPRGQGWLGNSAAGTEGMVGSIHRVTVYQGNLPADIIRRHSDAFNGIKQLPVLISFAANPAAIFTPASATLSWNVLGADSISLNGNDVSGKTNLVISPASSTTYTLVASNGGGSVTGVVSVAVNPAPVIKSFTAAPQFAAQGIPVLLSWNAQFAEDLRLSPGGEELSSRSTNGVGSISVSPSVTTSYALIASNRFGTSTGAVTVAVGQPANHPVISEFLAANNSGLVDEDGSKSDWIEIFNPTSANVNLLGFFLTDEKSNPAKWAFPSTNLNAGSYLVVFASNKNRTNAGRPLHTNFQLNKDGEYLALTGPGGSILQQFAPYPAQRDDISYGIVGGDPSLPLQMGKPTPGKVNDATAPPPESPKFSRASGFFTNSFVLTLSSTDPAAEIRYTTNASLPSATNGFVYRDAITVTNTRKFRAISVASGRVSAPVTASYVKLAPDLAGYTSTLPIMIIENFGAGTIPQKGWSGDGSGIKQLPRQYAVWATFERENGVTSIEKPPQMFSEIGIRGRGAFSSTWRQKPYSVEAINSLGDEKEVSPLGMPEHADWVLYFPDPASDKDPALLFNTFAYDLSRSFGDYAVRFRWVEAFINEDGGDLRLADRRGVYAIIEKVSRGKDRLNFTQLSPDGSHGSWLLNINRMDPQPETGWPAPNGATRPWFFHTAGANRIAQSQPNGPVAGDDEPQQSNGYLNFDNPNGYTINTNQRAAIELWFKRFEDVLWNNSLWKDPVQGYRKYIDVRDFLDYFIINNLTRNGDGLLISMFPWKGDDNKLRMGPSWDYNWSSYYISGAATGTLLHRSDRLWYKRLFTDPDFNQAYVDRWFELRRGPLSGPAMDGIVDAQVADISPAKCVLNGFAKPDDWARQITQFKTWVKARADWIDRSYPGAPAFNQNGGQFTNGFQLSLSSSNGVIYFTTDGSDPRATGGGISSSAQAFQTPATLRGLTLVQARVRLSATTWSAPSAAIFYPDTATVFPDFNGNDAIQDWDGDGMSNFAEFLAGTDPKDPLSRLRVENLLMDQAGAVLSFLAISNKTYSVQYQENLGSAAGWLSLTNLPPASITRLQNIPDRSGPHPFRFYRLLTP